VDGEPPRPLFANVLQDHGGWGRYLWGWRLHQHCRVLPRAHGSQGTSPGPMANHRPGASVQCASLATAASRVANPPSATCSVGSGAAHAADYEAAPSRPVHGAAKHGSGVPASVT